MTFVFADNNARRTGMMKIAAVISIAVVACVGPATAGPERFIAGTKIEDFGRYAPVADPAITARSKFKVAFDVSTAADQGKVNKNIESAARFLNMVTAAGARPKNVKVAIVVHGSAAVDLQRQSADGTPNPNAALVEALIAEGVSVQLCGQTAAMRDIDPASLVAGVVMPLSAMTAHAALQKQGYSLNPF
jgi:intracellular sulfur oxidation DsrE/DsrF family protein